MICSGDCFDADDSVLEYPLKFVIHVTLCAFWQRYAACIRVLLCDSCVAEIACDDTDDLGCSFPACSKSCHSALLM